MKVHENPSLDSHIKESIVGYLTTLTFLLIVHVQLYITKNYHLQSINHSSFIHSFNKKFVQLSDPNLPADLKLIRL